MMADDLPQYTVTPGPQALGQCFGCGYSLTGLEQSDSDRCPECGRPFDPRDPSTTHRGLPLTPYARWVLRPAGVWTFLPLVAAAGWALWKARVPSIAAGVTGLPWILMSYQLVLFRMKWLPEGALKRHDFPRPPHLNGRATLVALALAAGSMTIAFSGLPMQLAFAHAKPELDALAASLAGSPPGTRFANRDIGSFRTTNIYAIDGEVTLIFEGHGHLRWCPLDRAQAYAEDDPKRPQHRLGGNWYRR